jgi:hypothetical protein
MIDPKEEEIQEKVNEMMILFKKMDEFIFSSSYRIIRTLDDYFEEENEDNSLCQDIE